MYWDKLLTPKRHRETPTVEKTASDNRTAFKKDFDTVCNSTILRRLQDKAQVFPLEDGDYARTRLTHSIEVMSIAESLGMQAVNVINNHNVKYISSDSSNTTDVFKLINDIPTILKTVALLHDMGNPPFGHLGEQIIGDWFRDNLGIMTFNSDKMLVFKNGGDAKDTLEFKLNGKYAEDLKHFEGNAQLFRLVNKLSLVVDEFGMNLTYPVMSTFIKYPVSSTKINVNKLISKKMGYFSSEEKIYDVLKLLDIDIKTAAEEKLGKTLDPSEYEEKSENVWIAKSATVAPTASITGPAIIGKDAEVRHCAFIRGKAIVGEGAVVGNSTELKNAVLFNKVQVPHYNYVGDAVLGYKSHMGAGSICSNVKSDKKLVVVKDGDEKIETGLKKFGAMLGDHVEVGCGSVLNPGTVIGRNSNIYPLSPVRGCVPADSIYKNAKEIVKKK